MRFGIFDHNDASGRPAPRQLAERLELVAEYERLGFHAYHLAEHHGTPLGITPSPHLLLAAASQRTSRIRLGTLISILPLYHPMRVIEEACTLDQLTGGRLDLGVGRGISPIETSFHGVPGDETPARFDEAFEILYQGLTSDTVDFHGKYYAVDNAPVVTRPVQQPHPPLWYGTRTLDRARWCARLRMPMMALVPSEKVRPLTDAYRSEVADPGPGEPPPLGVTRSVVLAPTADEAMTIANRAFARFKANFELLWRRYDVPMPPVLPADTFAGVHATGHFYAGDPAGAREWVARHRDIGGINYMALEMCFGDMTPAEVLRSAELFATEVSPAFT
ncbi:MAG TPA: LLM class flavin-dependent oxidoreductase [Trebonia sp.]|jgi:alkanesulfonate monooxygenase SsuD/methylene tetrahydromethanopterin reductase-like flavin-dependent oxidoreductase (luciferase family)|nr:LLM class flavin-dependent oxidoreductase [Trebonia sp.]